LVRASGTANISVKPDQAEINIGVVSEAETAKAAAAANAEESTRVLEQLKKGGGENTEIRTISYSVHPRYRCLEALGMASVMIRVWHALDARPGRGLKCSALDVPVHFP
jgi:uncharacterized protein YggE